MGSLGPGLWAVPCVRVCLWGSFLLAGCSGSGLPGVLAVGFVGSATSVLITCDEYGFGICYR